jgi:hypothetical protein
MYHKLITALLAVDNNNKIPAAIVEAAQHILGDDIFQLSLLKAFWGHLYEGGAERQAKRQKVRPLIMGLDGQRNRVLLHMLTPFLADHCRLTLVPARSHSSLTAARLPPSSTAAWKWTVPPSRNSTRTGPRLATCSWVTCTASAARRNQCSPSTSLLISALATTSADCASPKVRTPCWKSKHHVC